MPLNKNLPFPKRARLLDKSSYIGIRGYFITINTNKRQRFFAKPNIISSLVKYLRKTSEEEEFDIIVYCFMPSHLHLVLAGQKETSDLQKFVKSFKQISGFNFKQVFKQKLWAVSFHDHVLRKEENIKSVGRYTLKNPLKAQLAKKVLDYPFSGSFVYDLKELVDDDPFLDNNSM